MRAQAKLARRVAVGLTAIGAALLTSSCAAGQHAATAQETPAIDGTAGQAGPIYLRAVGITTPDAPCYLTGSDAAMTLVAVNTGHKADYLEAVTSPRFSSSTVVTNADDLATYAKIDPGTGSCGTSSSPSTPTGAKPAVPKGGGPQKIGPGSALRLGVYGTGTTADPSIPTTPVILLRGLKGGPLYPGTTVQVTFVFASSGRATVQVPVQLSLVGNNSVIPSPPGGGNQ